MNSGGRGAVLISWHPWPRYLSDCGDILPAQRATRNVSVRKIYVSREDSVLPLHLAKAVRCGPLGLAAEPLACDLSEIDVCYGGQPGRDANMPVCLSLTLNGPQSPVLRVLRVRGKHNRLLDEKRRRPTVRQRLRISGPPVVAVMSRRVGSFGNPKGSRASRAIAEDFARLVSTDPTRRGAVR
jgi:hypothetical protein